MSTRVPAQHRARPLAVVADTAIAEAPLAHGLAAILFPPKPGRCSCCSRQVDRITRDRGRCDYCVDRCYRSVRDDEGAA